MTAVLGLAAAWFPVETAPWGGVAVAAILLVLLTVGRDLRLPRPTMRVLALFLPLGLWTAAGLVTGWDRSAAVSELGLATIVVLVLLAASREQPSDAAVETLALGLTLLVAWALWQVAYGFSADLGAVSSVPQGMRAIVRQKILTGRAFASFTQPGHLAVLLATVATLAAGRIAGGSRRWLWAGVLLVSGIGILLARSPLGAGLALLGVLLAGSGRSRRIQWLALAGFAAVLVLLVGLRSDLGRMEPIRQRAQNWRQAVWVWRSAPIMGVGLGGFGQAALADPGPAANHPQHAHCLPLELLAELGPIGLGAVIAFYLWLARLAWKCRPRDPGLAAAILIVPVHNLFDFSLYMWGVAIPWALLVGWAVAEVHAPEVVILDPVAARRFRPLVIAGCGLVLVVAVLSATAATLERAASTVADPGRSSALAARALAMAPWRLRALQPLAAAAGSPARLGAVIEELDRARRWRPHSPALALAAAEALTRVPDPPAAVAEAWSARAYAPPRSGIAAMSRDLLTREGDSLRP